MKWHWQCVCANLSKTTHQATAKKRDDDEKETGQPSE